MKIVKMITACAIALTGLTGFSQGNSYQAEKVITSSTYTIPEVDPGDIVDVAASNEAFSTLVTAVKAADLVETLKSEGPFTVFAPTNEAFDKLPEGTVAMLLKEENKEQLTAVLTYHVVAGKITAKNLLKAINASNGSFEISTVQGQVLIASIYEGNVILTDANGNASTITATDVTASNGVIHVINNVVLPKS